MNDSEKTKGNSWRNPNIKLFSEMSHDLKTPINIIYSSIQLMDSYKDKLDAESYREKAIKQMDIIRQNCYRVMRMTNNLIDLSCHDSGFLKCKRINYDIVKLVKDIILSVKTYVNGMEADILFESHLVSKIIACDPDMIERILLNLISNALKFVDGKGIITIVLSEREDIIIITVKDTGVGISEDKLSYIFDLFNQAENFYSRHNEGCGMGLYIVKAFVEAHGGKIYVSSKVGEGSSFEIILPAQTLDNDEVRINNKVNKKASYSNVVMEPFNVEFSDIYSCIDYDYRKK